MMKEKGREACFPALIAYDMCAKLSSVMPALSRHPATARLRREE